MDESTKIAQMLEEIEALEDRVKQQAEEVRRIERIMREQYHTIEVLQDAIVNQAILLGMAMEWGSEQSEGECEGEAERE